MLNPIPLPESLKRQAGIYRKAKQERIHNDRQAKFKADMEKSKARMADYHNYRKRELHNIRTRNLPEFHKEKQKDGTMKMVPNNVSYDKEGQRIWE